MLSINPIGSVATPAVFQPVLDNYSWFTPALYGVIVDGANYGLLTYICEIDGLYLAHNFIEYMGECQTNSGLLRFLLLTLLLDFLMWDIMRRRRWT